MVDTILALVHSWPVIAQVFFLTFVASAITVLVLPVINGVFTFVTETLPILVRGWPPGANVENAQEDASTDDEDETD